VYFLPTRLLGRGEGEVFIKNGVNDSEKVTCSIHIGIIVLERSVHTVMRMQDFSEIIFQKRVEVKDQINNIFSVFSLVLCCVC
jgi:hypothetical protein